MNIWIDAQLPPALANWLTNTFFLKATSLRELNLRDAQDLEIFKAARLSKSVVMTKDSDFIDLSVSFRYASSNFMANLRKRYK